MIKRRMENRNLKFYLSRSSIFIFRDTFTRKSRLGMGEVKSDKEGLS